MMNRDVSSTGLFMRFQPKFKEIVWHANEIQGESLLLAPGYFGRGIPIPPVLQLEWEVTYVWWSNENYRQAFNLREGKLALSFSFDPSGKLFGYQLAEAVMRAIYDGPFKGRRFFMKPKSEIQSRFCHFFRIPIDFRTDGGPPIPGLHLGEATAYDWRFFIPEGLERETIQAAVDIERAQDAQAMHPGEYPDLVDTMRGLRMRLNRCLCAFIP